MLYKVNVSLLLPGDIILVGYNDKRSREIQKRTNSQFSHAMLYWYDSILHASNIVITKNPSRILLKEDETACIMRLKDGYRNDWRIDDLIAYARTFVGTFYDTKALVAMKNGEKVEPNENRQMCAKYVAQCYDYVCLDLVENYELCSPEDIHKSKLLYSIDNILLEATQEDIDFAKSYDVTQVQFESIYKFLISLNRKFPKEDIVSLNQLEAFIEANPSNGDCALELMRQTDYFDLWRLEKEHCQYLYDVEAFKNKWKGDSVNQALGVIDSSKRIIKDKQGDIQIYEKKRREVGDIEYYRQMIDLKLNVVEAAKQRIKVAEQVLAEEGIVKIKYPWCQ